MFFVCPQSIVEKYLEVGGRGRCRVSPRHDCKSGNPFVVKASEKTSGFVSRGQGQWARHGLAAACPARPALGVPRKFKWGRYSDIHHTGPRIRISTRSASRFTISLHRFFFRYSVVHSEKLDPRLSAMEMRLNCHMWTQQYSR